MALDRFQRMFNAVIEARGSSEKKVIAGQILTAMTEVVKKKNSYINDGRYLTEIQDVKKKISERPGKVGQALFIVEFLVMEVLADKGEYRTPAGELRRSNVAGEMVQGFINLSWHNALKLVKNFLDIPHRSCYNVFCASGEVLNKSFSKS